MKIKYIDQHGLGTLIKEIKKGQTGVYKVKGRAIYADVAFLSLPSAEKEALATGASSIDATGLWQLVDSTWTRITAVEEGAVYDVINKFTTTAEFREGTGHEVGAGTNIVAVNVGTAAAPSIKWDLFSGLLDLDRYQTRKLTDYTAMFENEAPAAYTDSADLPATAAKGTVIDGTIAVISGTGSEAGDVYVASVTAGDPNDSITWTKLGNETTVEGVLSLVSASCPNRPLTDAEIEELWANS